VQTMKGPALYNTELNPHTKILDKSYINRGEKTVADVLVNQAFTVF